MLCDQKLGWFCRDDVWKEDINGKHDKDKKLLAPLATGLKAPYLLLRYRRGVFFLGTFATTHLVKRYGPC